MKLRSVLCAALLASTTGFAAENDAGSEELVQEVRTGEVTFKLVREPGPQRRYVLRRGDVSLQLPALPAMGGVQSANLQFVSAELGFYYGYVIGYAHYPFLFRTTDGGKTWTAVLFKPGALGTPFRTSDLFMFDDKRGIAFANWNNEPELRYFLTTDGGVTWSSRKYVVPSPRIRVLNADRYLETRFSSEGEVTVTLRNDWSATRDPSRERSFRSDDFGSNFREVTPLPDGGSAR